MRPWLLFLPLALLGGCGPTQPATTSGDSTPASHLTMEQFEERCEKEYAVVYLVLPQTDKVKAADYPDKLGDEFTPFLDDAKNSRIHRTGTRQFMRIRAALVKDVGGFAARQTLGRVLAFDPSKRTVLVEYGAPPSARETWEDAAYLDRQVAARTARWDNPPPQGFPEGEVVYVQLRGDWSEKTVEVQNRLKALLDGPADKRVVWTLSGGPNDGGHYHTAMAPAKDLDALAKKIDFAQVILADPDQRALILGLPKGSK